MSDVLESALSVRLAGLCRMCWKALCRFVSLGCVGCAGKHFVGSSRWSVAAQQDDSPIIALLHANYGAGYLWALKDIATDQEIYDNTGIDIIKFKQKIIDIQDKSTRRVSKACPDFLGDIDKYLLKMGGDL